jgi:hypothetical protein
MSTLKWSTCPTWCTFRIFVNSAFRDQGLAGAPAFGSPCRPKVPGVPLRGTKGMGCEARTANEKSLSDERL